MLFEATKTVHYVRYDVRRMPIIVWNKTDRDPKTVIEPLRAAPKWLVQGKHQVIQSIHLTDYGGGDTMFGQKFEEITGDRLLIRLRLRHDYTRKEKDLSILPGDHCQMTLGKQVRLWARLANIDHGIPWEDERLSIHEIFPLIERDYATGMTP